MIIHHLTHDEPNPPAWAILLFRPALWAAIAVVIFAVVSFVHGHTFSGLGSLALAGGLAHWAWAETRDATS